MLVINIVTKLIQVSSVTSASACSLSKVQIMYLYRATSFMPIVLFKVYFLLNAEILQGNTAVFLILHSLIRLVTSAGNFHRTKLQ